MEELIIEYLDRNYYFTLSSYITFKLVDRNTQAQIGVGEVLKSIKPIFGVSDDVMLKSFDVWVDVQEVLFHNKLVDFNFKVYEKTGVDLGVNNLDSLMALEGERLNMIMEEIKESEG